MRLSSGDKLDARLAPVEGAGLGDCSPSRPTGSDLVRVNFRIARKPSAILF